MMSRVVLKDRSSLAASILLLFLFYGIALWITADSNPLERLIMNGQGKTKLLIYAAAIKCSVAAKILYKQIRFYIMTPSW